MSGNFTPILWYDVVWPAVILKMLPITKLARSLRAITYTNSIGKAIRSCGAGVMGMGCNTGNLTLALR